MAEGPGLPYTLLSSADVWDRIDPLTSTLNLDPHVTGLQRLPFTELSGTDFERLCYELLVSDGFAPRFFGRVGQADYGADIVLEAEATRTVLQCKNLKTPPSFGDLRGAFETFRTAWITKAGLPSPRRFIYCCPQPLNERRLGVQWLTYRDQVLRDTSIELLLWDRTMIESRLRDRPDIVAGLFSDRYAEIFCGPERWRLDDPWTRVQWGEPRHATIRRFLERHRRNAIAITRQEHEHFVEILDDSPVIAIRGVPGSGKTSAALGFGCALRDPVRRIYYATLDDAFGPDRLWQSVRRRAHLPSLFVLDDCHRNLHDAGLILERLAPELRGSATRLLLVLRDLPASAPVQLDNTPEWLAELEHRGAAIDMKTSPGRTRVVVEHLRPDMTSLSRPRLERLHNFSAGDLLVVDEFLSGVLSPSDLDTIQPVTLYRSLQTRYFGARRILPTIRTLAALAQFELQPATSFFEASWLPGERNLAAPLMTELFAPPRYQFLHSSLAEAVFRAQMLLEHGETRLDSASGQATADALLEYWSVRQDDLIADLKLVIRTRLKLMDPQESARFKSRILGEEAIRASIQTRLSDCTFDFLANCIDTLAVAEHPAKAFYLGLIETRLRMLLTEGLQRYDVTLDRGLRMLSRHAPSVLANVLREHRAEHFIRFIRSVGSLTRLARVLAIPLVGEFLSESIDESLVTHLIENTIATQSSVGTLSLQMRDLATANPTVLASLEQKIGAARLLNVIVANGTVFELFMHLKYASPAFAEALLNELDAKTTDALLQATVTSGRSIATLDLTLRHLGELAPSLLARLEERFGPKRFLDLILANGTILELVGLVKHVRPDFAAALLDGIDAHQAETLAEETIARQRSIGTLGLALRAFRENSALLEHLEWAIGPERLFRVIAANGTLLELLKILSYATPSFADALLDHFDASTMSALIAKTIAADRSVATIVFSIRDLKNEKPTLLARLEQSIGAERCLRLLVANGSIVELLDVLAAVSADFRRALIEQLDQKTIDSLVVSAIDDRRSIEPLSLRIRQLATDTSATRIEELIGIDRWWLLVGTIGTVRSLRQITGEMTGEFRLRFIADAITLDVTQWSAILARSFFRDVCSFAVNDSKLYPIAAQTALLSAMVETAPSIALGTTWVDLLRSRLPAGVDSDTIQILRNAYATKFAKVSIEDLSGLEFLEAASAYACVWRERLDLRPVLAEHMWTILGMPSRWPRKKREIASLRFLLDIARSEEIASANAVTLVDTVLELLDRQILQDLDTRPLFLLLWSVASLRYERTATRSFEDTIPERLPKLLIDLLHERTPRAKSSQEKVAHFMLGGLLAFLRPQMRAKVRTAVAPLRSGTANASTLALDQSFVPAFFALAGIALLQSSTTMYSPFVRLGLLTKSDEHDSIGPALEYLRERVRKGSAW